MEMALSGGLFFWPKEFTLEAYRVILRYDYLWVAFGNSAFITAVGTVISVLFTATTAYPLIKKFLPGQKTIIFLILFTMLFQGGLIPTYLVVKELGLLNSLWSIILPTALSGFNVVVVISFFRTLPAELEESAMMDGGNPITIFARIVIPLSKPVLATIALWESVNLWNNYIFPLMYLNDKAKYTLPILLRDIINGQETAKQTGEVLTTATESVVAATIVMVMIPIMLVYPFLQTHFAKGALVGSLKQ